MTKTKLNEENNMLKNVKMPTLSNKLYPDAKPVKSMLGRRAKVAVKIIKDKKVVTKLEKKQKK